MLKFIGCGSAFAVKTANNSAFFIDNDTLNLFDCGETIFENIVRKNLLKGIKKVNIFLTHLHSDHSGSLGTMVFYVSSIGIERENIRVIFPNKKSIVSLLNIFDIINECVFIIDCKAFEDFKIEAVKQKHSNIPAYGYLFTFKGKTYYFSGDAKEFNPKILKKLLKGEIDEAYIDTDYPDRGGKYHLEFKTLKMLIPKPLRSHVVCMHLCDGYDSEAIKKEGFNLPNLI